MLRTLISSRRTPAHIGGYAAWRSASKVATKSYVAQTSASFGMQKDASSCVTRSLSDFMKNGRLILKATAPTGEQSRKAAAEAHVADVAELATSAVLLAYPDGSWRPSLGLHPRVVGAAAVGFLTTSSGLQEVFARKRRLKGSASLQKAELVGTHMAIEAAIEAAKLHGVNHIQIFPDDNLIVKCLRGGGWKRDGAGHYADVRIRLYHFLAGNNARTVSFKWIPAHCGIPGNARAHQLARAATKVADEGAGAGAGVVIGMRQESPSGASKQL